MAVTIIRSQSEHIPVLAPLLDAYRVFYKQDSDIKGATQFLEERLQKNESVLFLSLNGEEATGFVQLFPSFSTVSLQPIFILNDLYVVKAHRKMGIGEALLRTSQEYCQLKGFKGLALETALDNPAQALYERMGWQKDVHCFHYFWTAV
ncbi:MAG: GNAT family N-acetyltransferase [Eudoraea sp.]|nr:GNAT family N-acetyltransferase [Eudoraea sp.]